MRDVSILTDNGVDLESAIDLLDYMYINSKNFKDTTYPEYLPSFDEFINDIMELDEIDESIIQD